MDNAILHNNCFDADGLGHVNGHKGIIAEDSGILALVLSLLLAICSGLAQRVLTGGPAAAEAYLGFLKAGGSRYPLDALRAAGVDLATPAPVETAFGVLEDLIERLDGLVN